jgi:hypothetical protein
MFWQYSGCAVPALTDQRVAAIFLFDRDDHWQFKDLMPYWLGNGIDKGVRQKALAMFATFRKDVVNCIHFPGWQKLSVFAFMAGLAPLLAPAFWFTAILFHTGWIRGWQARGV